jgi:ribosome maturation factor RimP
MDTNTLKAKVEELIGQIMEGETAYFVVSVKVKPTNNIKIFLDGDEGIAIDKCIFFNRKIYKTIEELGWFPDGDFSLEISSPGVDEPLLFLRQYKKNIGRKVEVTLNDETKMLGVLTAVAEKDIIIEWVEGKGKKAVTHQSMVPFDNIKQTIVQIQF